MPRTNGWTNCHSALRAMCVTDRPASTLGMAALIAAASAMVAMPTAAFGSIMGRADTSADATDGLPATIDRDTSTEANFRLRAEARDTVGGHGLAITNLDFLGGTLSGRTHACVGPAVPHFDRAGGSSSISIAEQMRASAPTGTNVTFSICWSITSNVYGNTRVPSLTSDASALNNFGMRVGPQATLSGMHGARIREGTFDTTGVFAVQPGLETITTSGMLTISVSANTLFDFRISMTSTASAASFSGVGLAPEINASAGYAMTFGLASITPGARLLWQGQEWTGNCDDSSGLVPPNDAEVPAPSTLITLCIAAATIARRRR
jgi:hypothetical protein